MVCSRAPEELVVLPVEEADDDIMIGRVEADTTTESIKLSFAQSQLCRMWSKAKRGSPERGLFRHFVIARVISLQHAPASPLDTNMVMLQLTTALETRLSSLDLPPELAALVASYVTASDSLNEVLAQSTNEQQSPRNRTIEHAVLVRVARQCRSAETSTRERFIVAARSYALAETLLTTACTLASLLALTDIHAPPLPVREKVRRGRRGCIVTLFSCRGAVAYRPS